MLRKCENFCNAVLRLSEALEELAAHPESTTIRDGVIQRFEFTFELSWKSLKEYLEEQGLHLESPFPKPVFKAAYAANLISDEQVWLSMLLSRNLTSHVYDDAQATQVAAAIRDHYLPALRALAGRYTENA